MRLKIIVVAILTAFANVANAADAGFDCSLWASAVSRSLFSNSGTYATKGAAVLAVPECVDKSGFYGNLFLSAPLQDFDTGKEVDIRIGRRFKAGQFDVDVSVAEYYFGIGAPAGSKNMYNTFDSRIKISRDFDLGGDVGVQPYVIGNYQRSFDLHANQYGVAGGAVVNWKLGGLPGQPVLSTEVSGWYYPTTSNPGKGPIWNTDVSLEYKVGKVSLGPQIRRTWGDVLNPDDHKPKNMYGLFMIVPF